MVSDSKSQQQQQTLVQRAARIQASSRQEKSEGVVHLNLKQQRQLSQIIRDNASASKTGNKHTIADVAGPRRHSVDINQADGAASNLVQQRSALSMEPEKAKGMSSSPRSGELKPGISLQQPIIQQV